MLYLNIKIARFRMFDVIQIAILKIVGLNKIADFIDI